MLKTTILSVPLSLLFMLLRKLNFFIFPLFIREEDVATGLSCRIKIGIPIYDIFKKSEATKFFEFVYCRCILRFGPYS